MSGPLRDIRDRLEEHGLGINSANVVYWLPNAFKHPRHWPLGRKLYDTGVLVLFIMVSAFIGNVGANVGSQALAQLGVGEVVGSVAFVSMFFYGQAIGGLLIPPFTESFGRKQTNLSACGAYAVSCAIVGIGTPGSLPAVFIGRFCCGFLSALPTVAGSGAIEDMWNTRDRIWAVDIWIKASIVGIAAGPAFAVAISESSLKWPWIFYLNAIFLAIIWVLFLWTRESRPSIILKRQIEAVEKESTEAKSVEKDSLSRSLIVDDSAKVPTLEEFTRTMLIRPVYFFFTEPIVSVVSVMSATIFGSVYLQTEGYAVTYREFGLTPQQTSFVFLAWAVGLVLTFPIRTYDWKIISRRLRSKQAVQPEDKITGFYIAAPVLAVAFWWFAWTTPPYARSTSPFVSIGSIVLIGACTNDFDGILQGYLTDSYGMYAGSANAPLAFLRGILSGSFPIFGRQMFSGLGSNISGSMLAAVATLFCFIAAWFWKSSRTIREASKYATAESEDTESE